MIWRENRQYVGILWFLAFRFSFYWCHLLGYSFLFSLLPIYINDEKWLELQFWFEEKYTMWANMGYVVVILRIEAKEILTMKSVKTEFFQIITFLLSKFEMLEGYEHAIFYSADGWFRIQIWMKNKKIRPRWDRIIKKFIILCSELDTPSPVPDIMLHRENA